jgi:8-amino-7-oxononanoate synthase
MDWVGDNMRKALERRIQTGKLRQLPSLGTFTNDSTKHALPTGKVVDFSSNDYLGLAHSTTQHKLVQRTYNDLFAERPHDETEAPYATRAVLGATGSRLLSGDSGMFHDLESKLALLHRREAALLCNSGYDANLTMVSCLPCRIIVYDEYIHNSLHMGIRLWQQQSLTNSAADQQSTLRKQTFSFRHNNVEDLRSVLDSIVQDAPEIVILAESVYSMDGDVAPLHSLLDVALECNASVVVDEAHGLGVVGFRGLGVLSKEHQTLNSHPALLASIYTFGKAAGCHGAVICGSTTLKSYLLNFGYPVIYSTSLPMHSLVSIDCAYDTMASTRGDSLRTHLFQLVQVFRSLLLSALNLHGASRTDLALSPSTSPIQALLIPGNATCAAICDTVHQLSRQQLRLYPIKSPTVPVGQERIRIVLHSHNCTSEVQWLVQLLTQALQSHGLLKTGPSSILAKL